MFGGLAAAYGASDSGTRGSWAHLTLSLACLGLVFSVFCASMAAIPRLLGPVSSLIFFARISEKPSHQFNEDFLRLDDSAFLNDLTTQIHRNAEIATAKHAWVRRSLICSFIASIPWVSAIAILVKI